MQQSWWVVKYQIWCYLYQLVKFKLAMTVLFKSLHYSRSKFASVYSSPSIWCNAQSSYVFFSCISFLLQAINTRDALAKSIYCNLFDWLVGQINKSLGVGKCCTGRSISILDIFGFESFNVWILWLHSI